MKKIRVMHLIHQLGAGGAENGIINLVNHISNNHFNSAVCALVGNGSQTHRLDRDRTDLFEIGKSAGNDINLIFQLYNLFKFWKPHVVHTHAWGTLCEGFMAAKLARVPIIIHGEHGTIQNKKHNILVQRFVWRFADQILSVSFEHAKQLSRAIGFPIDRIAIIPNGVDSTQFNPLKDGQQLRSAIGWSSNDILIGTVGRLVTVKNHRLLIKAFAQLQDDHPQIKLVIAGDGPLKNNLVNLAKDLGCINNIFFLGRRTDIPEVMATFDLFVLPSHNEGMSNTILEAMSSGLSIIATDVGGNPELVIQGKHGLLVKADDEHDLVQALARLISNAEMRDTMGTNGRLRVEQEFSLYTMVSQYERLYKRCLHQKRFAANRRHE